MSTEDERRPQGDLEAAQTFRGVESSVSLDGFTRGILADAYLEGRRKFWLKRAEDFRRAKPMPGEYVGNCTREELSARWRWLDEIELACRAKAELVGVDDELEALLDDLGRAA